jgi:hypothetical protein
MVTAAACAPSTSHSTVAFASAAGIEDGHEFGVLRFTPSGRSAFVLGTGVAQHPSGDVVIAGVFSAHADVGGGEGGFPTMTAFVGRYAPSGRPRWLRWASTAEARGPRIAIGKDGDIVFLANTRFAPRPFGEPEPNDAAELNAAAIHVLSADGDVRWSRFLRGKDPRETMQATMVAADASGDVTIGGAFGGTGDGFVARFGESGRRWFTRVHGQGGTSLVDLAVLPGGDVVAIGDTSGPLRIDDTTLPPPSMQRAFLSRLASADGAAEWLRPIEDAAHPNATPTAALAIAASGPDLAIAWRERTSADTAFVELRDGKTAAPRWSRTFAKKRGFIESARLVVDGGDPAVAFVGTTGPSNDHTGATVLGLTGADGTTRWTRDLRASKGGSWYVRVGAIAPGPGGAILATGHVSGRADLGGMTAEGPWGRSRHSCAIDDDDDACFEDWAAQSMFVARIRR